MSPEIEQIAREIANRIESIKSGLDSQGIMSCAFALAEIDGMVTALTYVLGRPDDLQLAEQFIKDAPTWRAFV